MPMYPLSSSGERFTYMYICTINYITLWRETISLVSSSCYCPGHCYCYSSGQLAARVTHGCFNKDEFLAKGRHSFSFSAVHEAACIARRFASWRALSNSFSAGKRHSPWGQLALACPRSQVCLSTQKGEDGVGPWEEKELLISLILPSASCWGSRHVPHEE